MSGNNDWKIIDLLTLCLCKVYILMPVNENWYHGMPKFCLAETELSSLSGDCNAVATCYWTLVDWAEYQRKNVNFLYIGELKRQTKKLLRNLTHTNKVLLH